MKCIGYMCAQGGINEWKIESGKEGGIDCKRVSRGEKEEKIKQQRLV